MDDNGGLNWNGLASANVDVSVAPRDLRLESQGNTHRVIFNGVVLITYTDPNNVYTSGQPGIAAADVQQHSDLLRRQPIGLERIRSQAVRGAGSQTRVPA